MFEDLIQAAEAENTKAADLLAKSTAAAEQPAAPVPPAAAPAAAGDAPAPAGSAPAGEEGDDPDGEAEPLGKSFAMTLEDGTVIEAIDGAELVKSLIARSDSMEKAIPKALGAMLNIQRNQAKTIETQGELIKSLREQMAALSHAPAGRKASIVMVDKRPPGAAAPAAPAGPSRSEILAKSMEAVKAGRLTGLEAAAVETRLNAGGQIPADMLTRIFPQA